MEKFRIVGKTTRKFLTRKMIMKNEKKKFSKNRKRRRERKNKVDDKLKLLINKLNLKTKRKKNFDKNKELQVEMFEKIMLMIPRNYNLNYKN